MTTQTQVRSTDEALKLALEALENTYALRDDVIEAITTIKEALMSFQDGAQPANYKQEPVAWLHWLHGPVRLFLNKDEAMMELDRLNREYPVDKDARQMKPLYTTPPTQQSCSQRPSRSDMTWVGLTDVERIELMESTHPKNRWTILELCEAKLRKLNESQQRNPQFKEFIKWVEDRGHDAAHTYNPNTGKWICLNSMTADLWKAWEAAHGIKE